MILGLLWTLKKILFRAELLLKLENYKSVADHRLHFSGIKAGSKISFHRHFKQKPVWLQAKMAILDFVEKIHSAIDNGEYSIGLIQLTTEFY